MRFAWPAAHVRGYLTAMILVAGVPLAFVLCWQIVADARREQQHLQRGLQTAAQALAAGVEGELRDSATALLALASRGVPDAAALQLLRLSRPGWDAVALHDGQGRRLLSDVGAGAGAASAAELALLVQAGVAARGTRGGAAGGDAEVSGVLGSPAGWQGAAVSVAVGAEAASGTGTGFGAGALASAGGNIGTASAAADGAWLTAWIPSRRWQPLLLQAAPPAGADPEDRRSVTLRDAAGRMVAQLPAAAAHAAGAAPAPNAAAISGTEPDHRALKSVATGGWQVEVSAPADALDGQALHALAAALGAAGACLLLGVTLALALARHLAHQIARPLVASGSADDSAAEAFPASPGRPAAPATTAATSPLHEIAWLQAALAAAQQREAAIQRRLQHEAAAFEAVFEHSPVALTLCRDADCLDRRHNRAMRALLSPPPQTDHSPPDGDMANDARVAGSAAIAAAAVHDAPGLLPTVFHQDRRVAVADTPLLRAARDGIAAPPHRQEWRFDAGAAGAAIASRWLMVQTQPLFDIHGRPCGAIEAAVDITAARRSQRRLLQVHRRLRHAQRLVDAAQLAGGVGFLSHWFAADDSPPAGPPGSHGHAALSGLATGSGALPVPERLAGWLQRIEAGDRDALARRIDEMVLLEQPSGVVTVRLAPAAPRGEQARAPSRLQRDAVRQLTVRLALRFDPAGRPQQLLAAVVDSTEQLEAAADRARLAALESAARQDADEAGRTKDAMLRMLGHELRNPVNAITAAVEVLRLLGTDAQPMAREARGVIERQTRQLAYVTGEVLDLMRAAAGEVVLQRVPLDLGAAAQQVVATLRSEQPVPAAAIELRSSAVWIDADPERVAQVLRLLLDNALQHTPHGTRIWLHVAATAGHAVVELGDAGPGLPQALRDRMFEPFAQGKPSTGGGRAGLGLGLALARRLVLLHGASIEPQTSGAGTVFTLRFPRVPAPAQTQAVARSFAGVPRNLLLVEDNRDAAQSLRTALELDGHRVALAVDGPDGLSALLAQRPEVAIIDIGLPGIPGTEVAREARRAGYAGRLIALSGFGSPEGAKEALHAGFDEHMTKPVDFARLHQLIARQ